MKRKGLWSEYYEEMRQFEIQEALDTLLADVPSPKILEAGCGSTTHFQLKPSSKIVGIDISQEQLDYNKALSRKILGDVQTYDLSGESFDAIICHFVLEHLDDPKKALINFSRGLSDNGVIIIVAPYLFSPFGLIAKFTLFWFHEWVYRVRSHGGRKVCIFPTVYRLSMTPHRVRRFAERNGLKIRYLRIYEGWSSWKLRRESRFTRVLLEMVQIVAKVLTFGRWDILLGTYAIVMSRGNRSQISG